MPQPGGRLRLADRAAAQLLAGVVVEPGWQPYLLDRDRPVEQQVEGTPDRPHAAAGQVFDQAVPPGQHKSGPDRCAAHRDPLTPLGRQCNGVSVKSVRIVQLDPATLRALADGELPSATPVPLTDHLTVPEHRPLWRRRSQQVCADPTAAAWVTGVVWAPVIGVAVGRPVSTDDRTRPARSRSATRSTRRTSAGATAGPRSPRCWSGRPASRRSGRCGRAYGRTTCLRALVESFGFVPVGQQWDDEDGLETVYERPA